jgi:RNA polymerase sigma-54 factor
MIQLSNVELAELLSNELIENPILEEASEFSDYREDDLSDKVSKNLSGDESVIDKIEDGPGDFDEGEYVTGNDINSGNQKVVFERAVAEKVSLYDHLIWQARMTAISEDEYLIYERLITELDVNGFIALDSESLAKELNVDFKELERIISAIQFFDPVGCCVSGVKESLSVQAAHYYPDDKMLSKIIKDYFSEIEKLNYEFVAKKLSVSVNEILEKSALIYGLSPYPGSNYTIDDVRYIIPDLDVKIIDGEIVITMNDEWIPVLKVNEYYSDIIRKKIIEKKEKEFIQEKLQSARSLIHNIEVRRDTILKTSSAIMRCQKEYLLKGPGFLKHLTHTQIAEEIGIHDSTVSRVTSGKYVQTAWGVVSLKSFFVPKIKSGNVGESQDLVLKRIREIIEIEDQRNPLSDDEIAAILKKEKLPAARRTVAKYRDMMNIPTSGKRKKINMIKMEKML